MTGPDLDHLALASTASWELLTRYSQELGCTWLGGPSLSDESTFYFCQVALSGGPKLEFLQPIAGAGSDFLRRFLDRNGPGPHHLTFKVSDFDGALASVERLGYDVVGIDRSKPDWQEGFLHPKQSHGIVIQLACQGEDNEGWDLNACLPPPQRAVPPMLTLIRHLVADLDAALELFGGPLAMSVSPTKITAEGRIAFLNSGPWNIELIEPRRPDWVSWMGPRPGRLLDLHLSLTGAASVTGAVPQPDGTYLVPPADNFGTGLVLCESATRSD